MSPSRLRTPQKRLLAVVVGLGVFMLADTLYLLVNRLASLLHLGYFAVTDTSLPAFYQVLVLSHTGVGLALVVAAAGFVVWHLPTVWRRHRRRAIYTGAATAVLGLTLAVTGLLIVSAASNRDNPVAYWGHVAAAVLVPAFYLAHRRFSLWQPAPRAYRLIPAVVLGLVVVAAGVHGLTYRDENYTDQARQAFAAGLDRGPGSRERRVEDYAPGPFVPANYVPTGSPFFPAATTTTTGGYLPARIITRGDRSQPERLGRDLERYGFAVEEPIGSETCARCHAGIVAQWSRAAHRFASFNNPFYEATITDMRRNSVSSNPEVAAHVQAFAHLEDKEAFVKSKWCSGCHDPALMLAGSMDRDIDRTTPEAQAGLTCLACHAMDRIHNLTGNGNYNIADAQEDPYLFPAARGGLGRFLHDTAVKARPNVHKRQMLKPFFRTGEYCATCHKVSLDTRLNGYRWVRGQDEYDNWHDSGVARNAARTFYLPETRRTCQDCHMPYEQVEAPDVSAKGGLVRSHRFLAVNTALPYVRGDQETIERLERFLQNEKLRVDLFAVHAADGQSTYGLDPARASVHPGQRFQFDVVVRNLGVGHTFPGGTNDSNEGWLEVCVLDEAGRPLAVSGRVQDDGYVDPAAHFYRALLVDRHSQAIHKRNAQDIVAPVYVNVIGPGTADVAHYSFTVPANYQKSRLTLRARLLWRKFDRAYTEFAYHANPAGFRAFGQVPELPITVIAEDETLLGVGTGPPAEQPAFSEADWVRFNDYGIGLLLQEDTQGAARAFATVAELAPKRLDGHRNLARVAITDGDLQEAFVQLAACESLAPGDSRTAWVWGVALQEGGRYAQAAMAYRRVLEEFPEDRGSWRNLGRVLYLDGKPEEALAALDRALAIDPEDRVGHYHRMLALRALGREDEARSAEAAYQYFQVDESAQEVTRQYRLRHEHDQREALRIHVHSLAEGA
ncbi:MAG: tetratricopeptide repeat protein [Candidatus Latescibacterota bacterium]